MALSNGIAIVGVSFQHAREGDALPFINGRQLSYLRAIQRDNSIMPPSRGIAPEDYLTPICESNLAHFARPSDLSVGPIKPRLLTLRFCWATLSAI